MKKRNFLGYSLRDLIEETLDRRIDPRVRIEAAEKLAEGLLQLEPLLKAELEKK